MDDETHLPAPALTPLPGSDRAPAPGARDEGPLDPRAEVEVTLVLRRRAPLPSPGAPPADDAAGEEAAGLGVTEAAGHRVMSRAQLAEAHGADPADVEAVVTALAEAGLVVTSTDAASRRVGAAGPASLVAAAFGTQLSEVTSDAPGGGSTRHRHRAGGLSVPASLAGVVTAVLGLDDRPQAAPHLRVLEPAATSSSYTPLELEKVYRFPAGVDGSGQSVAILELGGGFAETDLTAYFGGLGLAVPSVTAVGVDGGSNVAGKDPSGADGEVLLDIEVAGALAPGARFVVYFAPNTDRGFLDALATAAHAVPAPAAISISWGGPEESWTAQARAAFDDALADAAALGVTVTAAAGDNGSADGVSRGGAHADFPASSPHALACGGTSLQASAAGVVHSEVVWNGRGATGGGVSTAFGLPAWQVGVGVPPRATAKRPSAPSGQHTLAPEVGEVAAEPSGGGSAAPTPHAPTPHATAHTSGRGVPDVSAVADPVTGYQVLVDGQRMVIGGTSAVAPLWAALIARLVQARGGRGLGLLAPLLYAGARPGVVPAGFRDITSGTNGAYDAAPGWDACTGLGVPDGEVLRQRLSGA